MTTRIAIDCMGGDHGPSVTVPAVVHFLENHPAATVILVGREEAIRPYLGQQAAGDRLRIVHATEVVEMDESPSLALRNKKDSSMRVALNLVKNGEADACVSAGNTGALMAISRFVLKMLPGIDRPAICAPLPTLNGHTHMLDLGANIDCGPEHLLQFGIMGASLVSALEHREWPTVGLLNIGEEEIKGNEVVKAAAELLKGSGLNFIGNVEGDGIYKGDAEVVVCDGFVGNVILKTSESVAHAIGSWLKLEFKANFIRIFGAMFLKGAFRSLKQKLDPGAYGGAPLLGVNGVSVIGHGSSDAFAVKNGIRSSALAVEQNINQAIIDGIKKLETAP